MTTATIHRSGLTSLSKGLLASLLLVAAVGATRHFVPGLFGGTKAPAAPSVPPKAVLPGASSGAVASTTSAPGCPALPETRMLIWAWNAQQGLIYANGGVHAAANSLMCKHGVNLTLTRQDMVDQMQAELVKCATELGKGADDCATGAHYVAIMGDGAAAFFAALNPQLAKACPDCTAEIIGSAGYSRGEDKLLGLPAWRDAPASAAGGLIAGYLRDGDWNIAMKWAGDNGLCNNADETTYDPGCLNWVGTPDYLDAGAKYIAGYCEDRPVVSHGVRTGKTAHACVNGVVTWTPGDVNVAQGRGGLVSIASTKDYIYQMPNVVIGLHRWNHTHRPTAVGLLAAMTEGGEEVKQHPAARDRAAELSAIVYNEKDAAYWKKYFQVVTERDATGLVVELGGSSVNNLADNQHLFGLSDGSSVDRSIYAATYNVFGKIVVHYYPTLVPSYPEVKSVVDTSYLEAVAAAGAGAPRVIAEVPTYSTKDPEDATKQVVGRRSWQINFHPASATFRPDAVPVLDELYEQTVVTRTIVEINGHTDADGDAERNRELSRSRALAVRDYLMKRAPTSFTESRFRIMGYGEDSPIAANDTAANKARNRRVEIVMRSR